MAKSEAQAQGAAAGAADVSLLDQIVDKGRFGAVAPARERGKGLIKQFVEEVMQGTITIKPDTEAMLNARIAEIEERFAAVHVAICGILGVAAVVVGIVLGVVLVND